MKFKLSREFKIGFFGILMIASLYGGINFLKGSDIFTASKRYYAVYDQVNGLQASANVVIKGYKVGSITGMSYDPRKSDKVILELSVKRRYRIPDNSKARIFSDGIMSGKSVEIELGDSPTFLNEGDTIFSSSQKDFLEVAGSEFEFIKQRANDLVTEMIRTLNNINKVVADNKANIDATMGNLASMSGNLDAMVAQERNSVHAILSNFNELSAILNSKSDQIGNIITNVESFSDSLSRSQIPTVIAEMSATLSQLNSTLERVNQGEGTVGRFLNDEQLYKELVEASNNLSVLLEDIKIRPGRYVNFSIFGRRNRD